MAAYKQYYYTRKCANFYLPSKLKLFKWDLFGEIPCKVLQLVHMIQKLKMIERTAV